MQHGGEALARGKPRLDEVFARDHRLSRRRAPILQALEKEALQPLVIRLAELSRGVGAREEDEILRADVFFFLELLMAMALGRMWLTTMSST